MMIKQQIFLVVLLLASLLVYLFCSAFRHKSQLRLWPELQRQDKLWLSGLSLLYVLLSLVNFADLRSYDQAWHGSKPGDQLLISFAQPSSLSKLYYSTGMVKGHYSFNAYSVNNQALMPEDKSANLGYFPYFRWNTLVFGSDLAVERIILRLDNGGPLDITQLAIFDGNGKLLTDYTVSTNTQQPMRLDRLVSHSIPTHLENTWQSGTVFDEIFYATSAYQLLHGLSPDVWVHPQLGIYLILLGILVFGMSPFGWRIMPDLVSSLMLPLIYLFALRVFACRKAAIAACILFLLEFMHFTLGRTASIEPFVTFFLLLEYYFLYSYLEARVNHNALQYCMKYLLFSGICFGLAIATKWSALYSAPVILLCLIYAELIANRSTFMRFGILVLRLALLFIVLPALLYLLVYIPLALVNHSQDLFQMVILLQQGILNFNLHGLINATHPYASAWWSWPLDRVPLSLYYWQDSHGLLSSSLALLGNPAIYWLTWPVILALVYSCLKTKRNYRAGFILLCILAQYLPYAMVARISFIYYFYSVTPFLILGISYFYSHCWRPHSKFSQAIGSAYLLLCGLLFVLFFSALSGIEVPRSYTVDWLWWMKNWNF